MAKLILILLIAAAIYWWYRQTKSPRRERQRTVETTTMVRCTACELYLPPASATQRDGRWYCQRHK